MRSFLTDPYGQIFFRKGNKLKKASALLIGFGRRSADLLRAPSYHFIFIHREAAPIGPPVFEWILRFILRKKIIYDFDDAIWLTDKENELEIDTFLKWRSKVKQICRWSFKVSCSSEYLSQYASTFNNNVVLLPTTIDTMAVHNPGLYASTSHTNITIGWTGSYSTLKYLKALESIIPQIQGENREVTFLVIADQPPSLAIPSLKFIQWNAETEIEDLLKIDIGIMPLPDNDWARGKGGFKCLQYMALGIPAVASAVGVNLKIIEHGVDGFLIYHPDEWQKYLVRLIEDEKLRKTLGKAGQKKISKHYSVLANWPLFFSLFE